MVYLPQAVTHRSTNQARRRVTSFQPKRATNYATPPAQDNLLMKFSALNVDFSILNLDPLGSRGPAHVGVKEGFPA